MFERFTAGARAIVVQAQEHARRLGHGYIGCEHLLLAAASTGEPAGAALRERGVTPEGVEAEIVRRAGLGQAAGLFSALDRDALASIGIDIDAVRAQIEAAFGPDALTRAGPGPCRGNRPAAARGPLALLRRSRRVGRGRDAAAGARPARPTGHIPFTPRAKKSLRALPPRGRGAAGRLHRRRAPHARPGWHGRGGGAGHPVGARHDAGSPAYRHPGPLPAGQLIRSGRPG